MQRARFCALWGLGMMLATSSTHAGELELSVEGRLGGESNIFGSEEPVDDGTFEISPRLGVRERNDDFSYAAGYQPTHRSYMKTSGIDGVDHSANARGGWSLTQVDQIDARGSYYNGRQFRTEDATAGPAQAFEVNDRERVGIAEGSLGYQRLLSPRLSLGLGFDFEDFDAGTDPSSQTDSRAYTGRVSARYSYDAITQLGVSASGRLRENRGVDFGTEGDADFQRRASSETDVWDVLFSVSRSFSPTFDVSLQAGPSFIRQQQIPGGIPDLPHEEDNDVNVFAAASAEKHWQTADVGFSYVRTEARSGSVSSASSISDVVELSANRRFTQAWTGRWVGSWNRFDQIASQSGNDSRFQLTSFRTTGTAEYVLSRRITLVGRYTYIRQETERSDASSSSRINVHVGSFGVRYTFEPLSY